MSRRVVGVVAVMLIGAAGCGGGGSSNGVGGHDGGTSDAHGTGGAGMGGHTGIGGATGTGGVADAGTGGTTDAAGDASAVGGMTGSGGVTGTGGSIVDAGLLPASCPGTINGVLRATDSVQTGRESRIANAAACGAPKGYPGNAADPANPHLYNAYHFANPSADTVCFNFTLTYDSGSVDGSTGVQRYLTAYSKYDPANIGTNYLGDVGAVVTSPQTMGITVPPGSAIDVVVFGIDVAPAGTGSYTLSCSPSSGDGGAGADGGAGNDGGAPDATGAGGAGGPDGGGADGSDGAADAAPDA